MARKHVTKPTKIIDAGDISGNLTSTVVNVENLDKGSIHVEWSGTSPVGTITVEARNRNPQDNTTTPPWIELNFGSTISVSGNTGDHQLIFNELPFTEFRVQYVATSGTGSITATTTLKTVGA